MKSHGTPEGRGKFAAALAPTPAQRLRRLLDRPRWASRPGHVPGSADAVPTRAAWAEPLEPRRLLTSYYVDTFEDVSVSGKTTLREAILAANANPGRDDIFMPAGTYQLADSGAHEDAAATGDLDITESVNLYAVDPSGTTIVRGNGDRVFHVIMGGEEIPEINLTGISIKNGNAGAGGLGGGLLNEGATVKMVGGEIGGNSASQGDDYYNNGGLVRFVNVKFVDGADLADMGDFLSQSAADVLTGIDGFFGTLTDSLDAAFEKVNIPVIGDQFVEGMQPLFDSLNAIRTSVKDFLGAVLKLNDLPSGLTLPTVFQNALFVALGPSGSFDSLDPAVKSVLNPLKPQIQQLGLGLLQDHRADASGATGPGDITFTFADDINNRRWIEWNLHLGQRKVIDLPDFDLVVHCSWTVG